MSFGESAEGGQRQSVLIADTPYNVTLVAENISSQATKVRAIDIVRMDIDGVVSIKLVLGSPPMASVTQSSGQQTASVAAKDYSTPLSKPDTRNSVKEIRGVLFDVRSCEVTKFRTILCRLVVTSKFQDRTLNHYGGGAYTKVQDDTGKSYPTRMSFGESAEGGQRKSVLIADTPYNVTLTAENISSQATKVRAINIARMDIGGVGSIKLVLAHPPMIASRGSNDTADAYPVPTGSQSGTPRTGAKSTAPTVPTPKTKKPQRSASTSAPVQKPKVTQAVQTPSRASGAVSAEAKLPGCWNWSNGGYIVIDANGTVQNGPIGATWKAIDIAGGRYSITWPSIVDTLTLSTDGNTLSGSNSFGFPISAVRKTGATSSVVGTWLWVNGITVDIRADSSVVAGPLNGIWRKAGSAWNIEWPVVDKISLAKDAQSLSLKNQFGAVTAKRDIKCKGP